jgi:heparosan-N-sulfate-glucuronate 5-epimerase
MSPYIAAISALIGYLIYRFAFDQAASLYLKVYHIIRGSSKTKSRTYALLDGDGVPIVVYPGLGHHRNPTTISLYALKYYEEYVDHPDSILRGLFMNCIRWLVDNLKLKGDYGVWLYLFDYRFWRAPWVSSLAQGLGIQALARAFKLTGDKKYVDLAGKALRSFLVPIGEGGVLVKDPEDDGDWYDEYASPGSPVIYVLNGFTYSLIGIYEYYEATGDGLALEIFRRGIRELKRHISEYDAGRWTYYDRIGTLASESYHKIHVDHMLKLYKLTGDRLFYEVYERWKSYKPSLKDRFGPGIKLLILAASAILSLLVISLASIILNYHLTGY